LIVGNLVLQEDRAIADYVRQKLDCAPFYDFTTIGVLYRGAFCGGIVYHQYLATVAIELSAAFETPMWCRRSILRAIFDYPFNQLGVVRCDATAIRKNKRSRKLLKGLGFTEEGVRRKRYNGVDDLVMYGMLKNDCRWIKDH
jgi:RimJ/RimL family protein N-acetyltransferase